MSDAVFVDTSALLSVVDADEARHERAAAAWQRLMNQLDDGTASAWCHSGVITETAALVQRRLGMAAVRDLLVDAVPLFDVVWVDERLHQLAVTALLAADRRQVSLVDWTSFVLMRERGIDVAFAYDADFERQGFRLFDE